MMVENKSARVQEQAYSSNAFCLFFLFVGILHENIVDLECSLDITKPTRKSEEMCNRPSTDARRSHIQCIEEGMVKPVCCFFAASPKVLPDDHQFPLPPPLPVPSPTTPPLFPSPSLHLKWESTEVSLLRDEVEIIHAQIRSKLCRRLFIHQGRWGKPLDQVAEPGC